MSRHRSRVLRQELRSAGAQPAEINSLISVADQLDDLAKHRSANFQKSVWKRMLPVGLSSLACFAIGAWLVILAQPVLPSSWLFPVQKLSDNVAIEIHPAYRGTVMMKRAQQVKTLVASHAATGQILAALADYHSIAATYMFRSTNYDVLEFCESNLAQAAHMAHGPAQKAITITLNSLQSA